MRNLLLPAIRNHRVDPSDEPAVIELDGPPMAYFEIPLDYWATPNGELEAESHAEAARLVQRIDYANFIVAGAERPRIIVDRVTARLKELGGGYIWWRLRPYAPDDYSGFYRLRLGTTPALPSDWWRRLSQDVENLSAEAPP